MADEVSNLIMEQLHILRRAVETLLRGQDEIRAEIAETKTRIAGFEGTMGHVMALIGNLQSQIAIQTNRLDRMDGRFDRIEQRLDRIERHLDLTHA